MNEQNPNGTEDQNQANQPPQQEQPQQDHGEDITGVDESHLYAALSYLFLLVFIPLFMRKDDEFVVYHARQGLILFLAYILVSIIGAWIPLFGNLLFLLLVVISIAGVIQSFKGRRWKIPVITDIANKFHI